jgi:hypothetical protein
MPTTIFPCRTSPATPEKQPPGDAFGWPSAYAIFPSRHGSGRRGRGFKSRHPAPRHRHLRPGVRPGTGQESTSAPYRALEPDSASPHRTPDGSQDPQDHTNEHQDAADRVQNPQTGEVTDHQKNDPQNDRFVPHLLNAVKLADSARIPATAAANRIAWPPLSAPRHLSASRTLSQRGSSAKGNMQHDDNWTPVQLEFRRTCPRADKERSVSKVPSRNARLAHAAKHAELWNAGKKDE